LIFSCELNTASVLANDHDAGHLECRPVQKVLGQYKALLVLVGWPPPQINAAIPPKRCAVA